MINMKTIGVSQKIHRELMSLKFEYGYRKTDALLEEMIKEFKKERLHQASKLFRNHMKKKRITLRHVDEKVRKHREDIYHEWFN